MNEYESEWVFMVEASRSGGKRQEKKFGVRVPIPLFLSRSRGLESRSLYFCHITSSHASREDEMKREKGSGFVVPDPFFYFKSMVSRFT